MIYLDANIFVYPIVNPLTEKKVVVCRKIALKIAAKEILAYTSYLTWDEVVHSVKKFLGKDIAVLEGKKFIRLANLNFLKVDEDVIFKAQELISKYNLNPRDALHAATALTNNINKIISDDSDFDKIKELKRIKLEEFKH